MTAYKFTEEVREQFLEMLGSGLSRKKALEACGVTRFTLHGHMREDADFAQKVYDAQASAIEDVEDVLYEKCISGHAASIQFFLCNREPKRWRSVSKLQVEAAGGVSAEEMESYVGRLIEYSLGFIPERRRGEFLDGLGGVDGLPEGSRKGLPAASSS